MSLPELDEDLSPRNVLVPTDFSAQSYQALLYALAIAKYYASSVTLLHVIQAHWEPALQKAWLDIRKLETGLIGEGRLQEISHRVLVERGEIWAVVSEVLSREKIDLIVMGTHGRTGLEILLLGSFAETVFRRARCPVLTVGPRTRPATPNLLLKNILFPTDFSRESEAAKPYAFSLSRNHGAKLTLLNVVESGLIGPCTGEAPTDKKGLSYARGRLREMILHTTGRDPGPKLNVLAEMGSLVDTILKVTDRLRVDLIVLGISPPSKVADRLGRTDTYRIMCAAHCPVLTVRERFPGPYFERLFGMNAAKPRTESKTNSNSIKSGSTKSATDQRR